MFYFIFISLGITLLELASDLDLPRGGHTWHQLRNGQLPDVFTQGSLKEKFTPEWPFIFFTPIKSLYKNMLFTKISASNER